MRRTSNIKKHLSLGGIKGSIVYIFLILAVVSHGQEVAEKRIKSDLETIIVNLDVLDHIELFNSESASEIIVYAENASQMPMFQLKEEQGQVLIKGTETFDLDEDLLVDKVCSIEPNYSSYKIYIPKNRQVLISFDEGNFYTNNFYGDLMIQAEDGILKMREIKGDASIRLNAGNIYIHEIENVEIQAETNLGRLTSAFSGNQAESPAGKMMKTIGKPTNSIRIQAISANIYLFTSKG